MAPICVVFGGGFLWEAVPIGAQGPRRPGARSCVRGRLGWRRFRPHRAVRQFRPRRRRARRVRGTADAIRAVLAARPETASVVLDGIDARDAHGIVAGLIACGALDPDAGRVAHCRIDRRSSPNRQDSARARWDEDHASAGARSVPASLVHPQKAAATGSLSPSMRLGPDGVGRRPDYALLLFLERGRGPSGAWPRAVGFHASRRGVRAGRDALSEGSVGAVSDARGGVMSELLLDAAGRRRSPATCPATTPAGRRATRASATRPTRRRSRRSWRSCATPATRHGGGCAG